jgi:hypothetical protein
MAELSSRGRGGASLPAQADPPRGDEALDEWFARRLEAQGIVVGRRGLPVARIMAVTALAAALYAFWWAAGDALTRHDTSGSAAPAPAGKSGQGRAKGGSPSNKRGRTTWRDVRLSVLNGYGGSGAANAAESTLRAQGWTIGRVADAGTATRKTVVVFAPGFRPQARIAARRLRLGAPIPAARAPGVPRKLGGVALLLGPDGLPKG